MAGNPLKREYGHASIQMNSHLGAEMLKVGAALYYISWWPAPKEETAGKFAIGRPHIQDRTFEHDCAAEFSLSDHREEAKRGNLQAQRDIQKYELAKQQNKQRPTFYRQPDHKIQIPDQVNEGYGLDNLALRAWWDEFRFSDKQFHLLNFNCSSCASVGLIHSGARHFVPDLPREGLILKRNPKDVVSYATDVRRAVLQADYGRQWAEMRPPVRADGHDVDRFWMEEEWLDASKVTGFDHRYTSLKRIDQTVKQYDREKHRMPPAIRTLRMDGLLRLIWLVVSERPNSKRLDALTTLGKQAIREKAKLRASYHHSQCNNADVEVREDNLGIVN
jgi:hypothetical protein